MITKEDVEHIGWLARIEISEQETVEYMEKLNSVLEYFGQLDELPTEDVVPTYHVAEIYNVFREDVVEECLPQETVLANTEYKEDSAEEVTARYLEVIGKSKVNGYVTVSEKALEHARRIDSEGHDGLLAGVPIAIKDNISVVGLPNSCGSKILEGYVPPFNAHVIEKLLAAGAVILGKTNMDEFAMGSSTETSYFGPTANPWGLERVPGGSSGGSAAVVAAGEAPFALGSDTGGSVRCPAAFCGVVGLKPTYGAVSRYGVVAYANSLEQIGPLANNVADIAVLMDVIAGYDRRDSTSIDSKIEYQKALVDDVKGLKIGVPKEFFGEGIHPDVEKAVWDAIHKYESLGATWEEVSMPNIKYALASYYIIAMSEASSNLARFDGTRYGFRESGENWHAMVSKTCLLYTSPSPRDRTRS